MVVVASRRIPPELGKRHPTSPLCSWIARVARFERFLGAWWARPTLQMAAHAASPRICPKVSGRPRLNQGVTRMVDCDVGDLDRDF
jgi:hypothetical protein